MRRFAVITILMMLFFSCSKTTYKYGNYDEAAFVTTTAQNDKDYKKSAKTYAEIVGADKKNNKKEKKNKAGRIPPGACVDYACLLLIQKDTVKANQFFDKEIRLYPESATYVRQLKKQFGL